MSNDELFELVAVLTAKNMALEEEIKRLNKQTDRLWEDLKEYEKDQNVDEYEDDDVDDLVSPSDYYPNHYSDPKSVEVDLSHKIEELDQKFNSINSRLKGTNYELVKIKKILIEEEEDNG